LTGKKLPKGGTNTPLWKEGLGEILRRKNMSSLLCTDYYIQIDIKNYFMSIDFVTYR
jgi:hypothetical protein